MLHPFGVVIRISGNHSNLNAGSVRYLMLLGVLKGIVPLPTS
jgi:hypothetical protein